MHIYVYVHMLCNLGLGVCAYETEVFLWWQFYFLFLIFCCNFSIYLDGVKHMGWDPWNVKLGIEYKNMR